MPIILALMSLRISEGVVMKKISIICLALAGLVASAAENKPGAAPAPVSLAGEPGLATRYPGDVGLAADTAVVFSEDFETGEISDLAKRWTDSINKDEQSLSFTSENAPGNPGRRSLMITGTKGHDTGGDLWKLLDRGYEQLYARFYVKFAPDAPYVHHFVSMGGKVDTLRYPVGRAGIRPDGYDRFGSSIDLIHENTDPPGKWSFYTYWSEMHSWQTPEGESDGRPNPFYGNLFGPEQPEQARRGEWQCVEFMIKLNTPPDKRNGEQALWIDGRLVCRWAPGSHTGTWFRDMFQLSGTLNTNPQPFEGFLWRKTDQLKINTFRLQYYLASVFEQNWRPANPNIPYNAGVGRVQFDNVVLATRYIGPVTAAGPR
jgi:hypothetical protein